jgi:hypothetical protein
VVDPLTGQFTALVSAANAPGFKLGSAHGAEFVADPAHQCKDASVQVNNDGFAFKTGGDRGSIGTNDDPSFGRQGNLTADTFSHLSADAPPKGIASMCTKTSHRSIARRSIYTPFT